MTTKGPPPPLKPKPKVPPKPPVKKPELASQLVNEEQFVAGLKGNLKPTAGQITMTNLDSTDDEDESKEAADINDSKLKPSLAITNSTAKFPPPPVRRNLPPPVQSSSSKEPPVTPQRIPSVVKPKAEDNEPEAAPVLPKRPSTVKSSIVNTVRKSNSDSDGETENAPVLPSRPSAKSNSSTEFEQKRPSFLSPKKASRLDSKKFPGLDSDEEDAEAPPLPMRRDNVVRNIPSHVSRRISSHSLDSDDSHDSDDDKDHHENRSRTASSSSLLFDSAKRYSKTGYHAAKEKSMPYAQQAKQGLSKWKEKLSNSTQNLPDANHQGDNDFDEEEYYRSRRERAKSREQHLNPGPKFGSDSDSEVEDRVSYQPPKTSTKPLNGVPLPGMNKTKPEVPKKSKPVVPPKKSTVTPVASTTPVTPIHTRERLATPPPVTPRAVPAAPPSRQPQPAVSEKYAPPPPPTRARPASAPLAPPSRSPANGSKWQQPELDLELPSLWFVSNGMDPAKMPQCLIGLNCQMSAGFIGQNQFRSYALRGKDLSTIKLKLTWKDQGNSPLDTLVQELTFIPPPVATKEMIMDGHKTFGDHVASWCENKLGQQVGNGECWTLAHDALQKGCGKHAFVSSGLIHGALLYTVKPGNGDDRPEVIFGSIVNDEVRRGDVLQFKSCFFKYPQSTQTYGSPDHTAVVVAVEGSDPVLKKLTVLQQNVNGDKTVQKGELDLSKLKGGDVKVYRPVVANWVVDLMEVLS